MKSIREIIRLSTEYLQKKKIGNPRYEAECLVADGLGMTRLELYLDLDRPLTPDELDLCREILVRRGKGEPLVYIKGEMEFFGLTLHVTPAVLIPRQETELLADMIAKELEQSSVKGKVLWDICCGSGCLGLSLKKHLPDLQVTLSDLSSTALEVAQENAKRNELEVSFLQGDLFAPFVGTKADFIVCNPPYISEEEYAVLDREVRDYEPRQALLSNPSGLEFYQRISAELKNYLQPGGKVWLEIGYRQGKAILDIFRAQGWANCHVEKDLAGHDRFVSLFSLENE